MQNYKKKPKNQHTQNKIYHSLKMLSPSDPDIKLNSKDLRENPSPSRMTNKLAKKIHDMK